jgi:hypothetical protein
MGSTSGWLMRINGVFLLNQKRLFLPDGIGVERQEMDFVSGEATA